MITKTELETVHKKDLGVLISEYLKSLAHCTHVYMKANCMLGLINRTIVNKQPPIILRLWYDHTWNTVHRHGHPTK